MKKSIATIFLVASLPFFSATPMMADELAATFQKAPAHLPGQALTLKGMPLWHMNGQLTSELIKEFFEKGKASGFAGYTILPMSATRPVFLTEEYLTLFGEILETADKMDMKIVYYDDINFPSGTAGGRMQTQFPEDTLKRLDKVEWEFTGPGRFYEVSSIPLVSRTSFSKPGGVLMSAVAMNTETLQRIDLTKHVEGSAVRWEAPAGTWKIMLFLCVDGKRGIVDYLCPESSEKYLTITYDEFDKRFGKHFGTTIPLVFYDDLALAYTEGYRTWTPAFNAKFETKFGRDPALDYPALWYDIGPETTAARCALFGFRSQLFAEGHMRVINEWCRKRNVLSCGHPMGPYIIQPVDMGGDNFLFHKYADITLFDSIHYYGHGRNGFKIPTSASFNYDYPVTAVEIYGNYPDRTVDLNMLYRSAMEIFARGGNLLLQHGTWTDESKMHIPPDIAWKNPRFGKDLPGHGDFVSRCSLLLQGGRHVADIGMVYPIASLTGYYKFFNPPEKTHYGSYYPEETDYLHVSDMLTGAVWRDFTLLHPEIIDEKCQIAKSADGIPLFRLENKVNWEEYPVVFMPGGKVISWSNLQKIKAFHDAGGKVIASSMLPSRSTEPGRDEDVRAAIKDMFGIAPEQLKLAAHRTHVKIELKGSTINTYVNGHLVDTTVDDTFAKGGVGFRESDNEAGTFADLLVTAPDGSVLLKDDFKDLSQWQDTQRASVSESRLSLSDNQSMRSKTGGDWTDYAYECDLTADKAMAGLTFRVQGPDSYYMWQFDAKGTKVTPHLRKNGQWRLLKSVPIPAHVSQLKDSAIPAALHKNTAFLPTPTPDAIAEALNAMIAVPDIRLQTPDGKPLTPVKASGGMLQYIHKVKEGRNVYYFANSSDEPVTFKATLRGTFEHLECWNPHNGTVTAIPATIDQTTKTTSLQMELPPIRSVFIVEKP